jgi:hypothetical protein
MANTTYFGWETPDDTDLVKDGAAAIRTLGQAIDTSMQDLEGGTTGQILSKNSNADMDFVWVTNDVGDITEVVASTPLTGGGSSGSVTVGIQDGTTAQKGAVQLEDSTSSTSTTKASTPNSVKSAYDLANAAIAKSLIDAEGDLIVGDAADAVQRLAIGSNGNVLTVDTTVDGKIKWAAPAGGGGFTELASGSLSGTSVVVNVTTTGYKQLVVYMKDVTATADWFPAIRLNGDSGNNYTNFFQYQTSSTAVATSMQTNAQEFYVDQLNSSSADNFSVFTVYDPANSTTHKNCNFLIAGRNSTDSYHQSQSGYGQWRNTAAITSVTFVPLTTYSTGTYEIYGVK